MKKKKDKIDRLLEVYRVTSAQRKAKREKKEKQAREKQEARARFEEELKNKITGVFRPVMQQLLSRLDKKQFIIKHDGLDTFPGIGEQYGVTARDEETVDFWLAVTANDNRNKACFTYAWSTNLSVEKVVSLYLDVDEIDEKLISKKFMHCLQKICIS